MIVGSWYLPCEVGVDPQRETVGPGHRVWSRCPGPPHRLATVYYFVSGSGKKKPPSEMGFSPDVHRVKTPSQTGGRRAVNTGSVALALKRRLAKTGNTRVGRSQRTTRWPRSAPNFSFGLHDPSPGDIHRLIFCEHRMKNSPRQAKN